MKYLIVLCLLGAMVVHHYAAPAPDVETCKRPTGESGVCLPYWKCHSNYSVITDGSGMIDIRANSGACASYMDACCIPPKKADTDVTPPPTPPAPEGCGQWNKDGVGFKIIGDTDGEAQFGEFPWMCAILEFKMIKFQQDTKPGPNPGGFLGGGSLIHPKVVLTAAHNVVGKTTLLVRAGEWDTQNTKEPYPHQERNVAKIVSHEEFNGNNMFFDVAVLILETPMDLARHISVVCLPPPQQSVESGTKCSASGWGANKFGKEGQYQVILKKVNVPVVDHDKCEEALSKTRLGYYFELDAGFMCAGGERGVDTCKGDGGSPLVCPIAGKTDRYIQRGIVSWGIGCGEEGTPGVYTDVAQVRDWIDGKVKAEGLDPKVYTA